MGQSEEFIRVSRKFGFEQSLHRFYSVYRGVVTNMLDPLRQGRIKVKVKAISDLPELPAWANPVVNFAGNGYGWWFPPQQGDSVYVMFEHGDHHNPFWFGGWFAATGAITELPNEITNPQTTRLIKAPVGHALIFEDGPAPGVRGYVELHTGKPGNPVSAPPGAPTPQSPTTVLHFFRMSDLEKSIRLVSAGTPEGSSLLEHALIMHDAQKYLELSSGLDYILKFDDKNQRMLLASPGLTNYSNLTFDDVAQTVTLQAKGSAPGLQHSIVMDTKQQSITIKTMGAVPRQIVLNDTTQMMTISDPMGNIVNIGPAGIQVTSASLLNVATGGATTVASGGAIAMTAPGISQASVGGPTSSLSTGVVTSLFLGAMVPLVVGLVNAVLLGGLSIVSALMLITCVSLTVVCNTIVLGNVASAQKLLTASLLTWLSTHTHTATGPAAPTTPPIQAPALFTTPTFVTQNLKAS